MTTKIINYAGWVIILSASLYFIYSNALHYFAYNSKEFGPDFWPQFAPYLMIHIVGGMVALLLGPFQFIPAIRKKYAKTHRSIGKIYLCSVLIAAVTSFYLSIDNLIIVEKHVTYGAGLAGLAFAWLLTSGMAYWSVLNKNFVQHREWMVRSFVVTCAFASSRLFYNSLVDFFHTDSNAMSEIAAWACWAFPLMVTEVFLQGIKIRRGSMALANKKQGNPVQVTA